MRTMNQKRSDYVLSELTSKKIQDRKEFKAFTSGCPSIILQNGFGQTMAFFLSKGSDKNLRPDPKKKHIIVLNIIREWLSLQKDDIHNNFLDKTANEKDFVTKLSSIDQNKYLTAQKEALALLEWVKRYAAVIFEDE